MLGLFLFMESRKVGVLIGLENRDDRKVVWVRPPQAPQASPGMGIRSVSGSILTHYGM